MFLIATPDPRVRDSLRADRDHDPTRFRAVDDLTALSALIADAPSVVQAVILDREFLPPYYAPAIAQTILLRPNTPVFAHSSSPWKDAERAALAQLGVLRCLPERLSCAAIEETFAAAAIPPWNWGNAITGEVPTGGVIAFDPAMMVEIPRSRLVPGYPPMLDLFESRQDGALRLAYRAGTPYTAEPGTGERVAHYRPLFTLKASVERYAERVRQAMRAGPPVARVRIVAAYTRGLLNQLRTLPAAAPDLPLALEFAENALGSAQGLLAQDPVAYRQLLLAPGFEAHGVALALLLGVSLRDFGFSSAKTGRIAGLACLLHDVGSEGPAIESMEDSYVRSRARPAPSGVSPELAAHPQAGAKLAATLSGIDPAVLQAIAQHHERVDHSGFPDRIGGVKLHPLAEMIGATEEVHDMLKHLMLDTSGKRTLRPADIAECFATISRRQFSPPIARALQTAAKRLGGKP